MPDETPVPSDQEAQPENDTLPENEDPETDTQPDDETPEGELGEDQTDDEGDEPPPPPAPAPQPDPNQRLKEQVREIPVLISRNKSAEARIQQLTKTETPTEAELRAAFPDWDQVNETTRNVYRRTYAGERRLNKVENMLLDTLEQQEWEKDFARVLRVNPKLKGREEEFQAYAYKPAHKNVPLDVLVKSFLFDVGDSPPAPPAPRRSSAIEPGSGGPKPNDKPGEIGPEDAARIRATDPKRYRELVRKGRIKDDI